MECVQSFRRVGRIGHPLDRAAATTPSICEFSARMTASLQEQLVALLPDLRAFARSLEQDRARADDLVQETIARALAALDRFQPGTNLGAWTFTILRNEFYSHHRRQRRSPTVPADEAEAAAPTVDAPQESHLALRDLRSAFWRLPAEYREALILVTMRGHTYEEAAAICGCAVGTVKARVSRARARLQADMDGGNAPP